MGDILAVMMHRVVSFFEPIIIVMCRWIHSLCCSQCCQQGFVFSGDCGFQGDLLQWEFVVLRC